MAGGIDHLFSRRKRTARFNGSEVSYVPRSTWKGKAVSVLLVSV